MIEKDVAKQTRSVANTEAFLRTTADTVDTAAPPMGGGGFGRPGGGGTPLRLFVEERSKYLLEHPEVKKAGK
jgi:hypothetical protein